MARALTVPMDQVQLATQRRPAFRVFVYDILTGGDSINDIVRDLTLDGQTGPRDFTDDVISVSIEERAGDYARTGIAASTITVQIADETGALDPLLGANGRWLKKGNVIRIVEGDTRVDEDDWQITFTGKIIGQAGVTRSRTSGRSTIEIKATDRAAPFVKYLNTSDDFAQGTTYKAMATDIAQSDMGLDSSEIDWSTWGNAHV
ncbi:MAG: hypothetical protein PVG97_11530, partial [Syntrophobacterales bacterium]